MPKAKFRLECKGFEEYMEKLDKIGGSDAMKKGVERALKSSKDYVNGMINVAMLKPNLPAGGKYSHGGTSDSLDRNMTVKWEGLLATMEIGFNFKESGMKSIFLMYGTPRMKPVAGLRDAIYGSKTKSEIRKIQGIELAETLDEIMKGR